MRRVKPLFNPMALAILERDNVIMSGISTNGKRLFIARHGETIFNLAGRIQGEHVHTTRRLWT